MRLTELDPQWLFKGGDRIGFTFICPTDRRWRQSCFGYAVSRQDQEAAIERVHGDNAEVQLCRPDFAWAINGGRGGIARADFATMTVTPSLDGSAGGLWHVGGL